DEHGRAGDGPRSDRRSRPGPSDAETKVRGPVRPAPAQAPATAGERRTARWTAITSAYQLRARAADGCKRRAEPIRVNRQAVQTARVLVQPGCRTACREASRQPSRLPFTVPPAMFAPPKD